MRFRRRPLTATAFLESALTPAQRANLERLSRDIATEFGMTTPEAVLRLLGRGWRRRRGALLENDDRRLMAESALRIRSAFDGLVEPEHGIPVIRHPDTPAGEATAREIAQALR